jgi:hypothetical protein
LIEPLELDVLNTEDEEDKAVVVVVWETGLIEPLELDVLETEDEAVPKVDVLVVEPIIGLSMARPEVVVVETEDVLVVETWTGPFDREELTDDVEVLDDSNRLEEVELELVEMLELLELLVL